MLSSLFGAHKLVLGGFGLLGRRLGVGSSGTTSSSGSALLALLWKEKGKVECEWKVMWQTTTAA